MQKISKLILATHNKGKVAELQTMLEPFGVEVLCAANLGLAEPEETGTTFAENAVLKAALAAQNGSLPALADDSGLCVNALNGNPGIFSARWAGPGKDFTLAMEKIHRALEGQTDRSAYFTSILALSMPDGDCEIFEGRIDGTLVWPPRGTNGFGYDPMFVPEGEERTFGEMTSAEKEKISHRARAFAKFVESVFQS
jgi:XTP/dITP diphosphohydrolase